MVFGNGCVPDFRGRMTDFPDISKWQGVISFETMQSETDYVILKAGQADYVDPKFVYNRSECVRIGLNFGVYFYYDDRVSPGKQAEKLASILLGQPLPAEIFCDWENTYNGQFAGLKNVVAFMQRCEELIGMQMGMYTGYYWFLENSNAQTHASQYTYLKTRPLWLAWYAESISQVKIPAPWDKMNVWQYGTPAIGHEYGVESIEIDMNQRIGETPPDPVDPEEPMYRYEMVDIDSNENRSIRNAPNTAATNATDLGLPTNLITAGGAVVKGVIVEGDEIVTLTEDFINGGNVIGKAGDQWMAVKAVGKVVIKRICYVALRHMGITVCKLTINDTTPPDPEPVEPTLTHTIEVYSDGSLKIDGNPYP